MQTNNIWVKYGTRGGGGGFNVKNMFWNVQKIEEKILMETGHELETFEVNLRKIWKRFAENSI